MHVVTFAFVQGKGGKGRAVLKAIRKVISYDERDGTGGVQACRSTQLALKPAEWGGVPADGFGEASSCQRPKD